MKLRYVKGIFFVMFFLCITLLGSYSISYAQETKTYDISKQNVVITKSGNYVITGTTDKYTIQVNKGVSANITFKNVQIINPVENQRNIDLLDIKSGAAVNLILTGTNVLQNEQTYAAIHVPYGAKFIISPKSTGSLKAVGGYGGAAIGGSESNIKGGCGTILIKGGTIYAEGGYNNCAIGGGTSNRFDSSKYNSFYLGGGDITISGGKVTAVSKHGEGLAEGAAAIGGTSLTRQGKITITGGEVTAISNEAGIGGESLWGKGNIITISGGMVTAKGNMYGAGIGNNTNPIGTTVTISGGMVNAKGDYGDKIIYDAYVRDSESYRDFLKAEDIAAEKIVISGGNINAYTFSTEPVDPSGTNVYPVMINCGKGPITSMVNKYDISKKYGYKDMVSNGYLRMFMPLSSPTVVIKSNNTIIYNDYFFVNVNNSIRRLDYNNSLTFDLNKGSLELIDGGCIYNNTVYRTDHIIVTGTITKNQIFVHSNSNQLQNLTFQDVVADFTSSLTKDFLVIDNDVTLQLHLKGENSIALPDNSRGIFVGNDAKLCLSGDGDKDTLTVTGQEKTNVIFTNLGEVAQYGGNLKFDLGDYSSAVYCGNYGTFSLYNGIFEAHSTNGWAGISSNMKMQMNIFGGKLIADSLGVIENGNEEAPNSAYFTMTGGSLEVTGRFMFYDYRIYGGEIKARILGYGAGCNITVYGGNVDIGAFISANIDDIEESAIILGGTVKQRNDVPQEELDNIIRYLS